MIISICSTYLRRKGDIEEATCLVGFMIGLIEVCIEAGLLSYIIGG